MFNHEPSGYVCPFCHLVAELDDPATVPSEPVVSSPTDVVRRRGGATAFISPRWWPNNHGHVLVISDAHDENLYDLPPRDGHAVHDLVREVAIAMRQVYGCAGTCSRGTRTTTCIRHFPPNGLPPRRSVSRTAPAWAPASTTDPLRAAGRQPRDQPTGVLLRGIAPTN